MAGKMDMKSVSYVLGILSIVFAFFSPFAGLVLGIIGLVQSNKLKFQKAKRFNIIGIVLSAIFTIIQVYLQILILTGGTGLFPSV
ncbi:hypothetical protein ES703_112442 [subsurface metagenome]